MEAAPWRRPSRPGKSLPKRLGRFGMFFLVHNFHNLLYKLFGNN